MRAHARLLARALGVAPLALIALGVLAPTLVHAAFEPLCHQDPARSPALFGEPLAVCWRCLGLYAGIALVAFFRGGDRLGDARAWPLLLGLCALDWALKVAGLSLDHPVERVVTGVAGGAGVALLFVRGAHFVRSVRLPQRILATRPRRARLGAP